MLVLVMLLLTMLAGLLRWHQRLFDVLLQRGTTGKVSIVVRPTTQHNTRQQQKKQKKRRKNESETRFCVPNLRLIFAVVVVLVLCHAVH